MAPSTHDIAKAVANAIWDKKGFEVVALHVGPLVQYTDILVIASASSDRHAMAIADNVEAELLAKFRQKPIGSEGRTQGRWVVLDYSDFVVHVFHRPVREYYQLDRLYGDAQSLDLEEPAWVRETSPESMVEQPFDYGELVWQDTAEDSEDWEADEDDADPDAAEAEVGDDDAEAESDTEPEDESDEDATDPSSTAEAPASPSGGQRKSDAR